jgi:glyoxylase-like metal-dependent hydrolase (beta-lactamase superfamily II)
MARVVCHDKGIRHLVDPSKLWEGSRQVLGEIAEAFGPFRPVKEEMCIPHTQTAIEDLDVIETPGHAPHHLSFSYHENLFAGEAGGNYYSVQGMDYLRPATPPRFYLKVFLETIDRLMALKEQRICYAHFGDAPDSTRMLKRFRAQILRWKEVVQKEIAGGSDHLLTRCVDRLLKEDPDLKAFELMDPDMQDRERFFMANSVRGYVEFLQNES